MKKEIKIGDKTFEFSSPNIIDKSTTDVLIGLYQEIVLLVVILV